MANHGSNFLVRTDKNGKVTHLLVRGYSRDPMIMKGRRLTEKIRLTSMEAKALARQQVTPTVTFVSYSDLLDMPNGEALLDAAGI